MRMRIAQQSNEALLERLFTRIGEVSSLPAVALRIIELANDPRTGAEDLLEVVRSDPALAMRLMRTVNSSYYAMDDKVADLKQAITLLGFNEVRNLALTAYVAQKFKDTTGHGQYSRRGLWNHMVGTGMVARLLAKTCGSAPPQEAYLAGLLHDVGLILIDQYLHDPFCRVINALTAETPAREIEKRILGFNHAALGEFVATRWNLPEHVTAAIGGHHTPQTCDPQYRGIVYTVALADFFCHLKNLTSLGVRYAHVPPMALFNELGLHKQQVWLILEQLEDVLSAADVMAFVQVR